MAFQSIFMLKGHHAGTGAGLEETGADMVEKQAVAHALTVETEEGPSVQALQTSQAGRAGKMEDALTQLVDQIPRPNPVNPGVSGHSICQLALLTREFNSAMGLPEGASAKAVSPERGRQYGQMLREEICEVEEAIRSGVLHDVLAELTDIVYLTLNLGQECGLQECMEAAFLLKHDDNMRKQHESVTHLSWTRTAHAKACNATEDSMNYTVSRTSMGKWLLYSNGKLIKPYDYVPGDYSQLLVLEAKGSPDLTSEHPEGLPRPLHTSVHDSTQYTFAHIGVQAAMCDDHPKGATNQTGQHGWQSAIMTGMMWLSSVVGEYLGKLDQEPEVSPIHLPRLIDDPVSTLEQTVMDLQIAYEAREISGILKQLGLIIYYAILMATTMRLHPYLSSTFLWIHEWQLSKIYGDFAPAESAHEMLTGATMKEVKEGYVIFNTQTLKVLGDFTLEDKADVVLMTPVETLLDMVPARLSMPYTGLQAKRFPGRAMEGQEKKGTQGSSTTSSAL